MKKKRKEKRADFLNGVLAFAVIFVFPILLPALADAVLTAIGC